MHRLQELVRLHRMGRSARSLARQLRMGRATALQYLAAFREGGLLEGDPDDLPAADALAARIAAVFPARPTDQTTSSVDRWRPIVEAQLAKGAGPTPIHDFLRLQESDYEGNLSAIKRLCARIKRERGPLAEDVAIPSTRCPAMSRRSTSERSGRSTTPSRASFAAPGSSS